MSQVYVGNGSGGSGPANDLHVSKWIVNQTPNAGGNQTTLAAAMAAASAGDTIFLYPGTYNENVTWTGNVAIVAFPGTEFQGTVNLNGTLTINSPGFFQISGIRLNANASTSINFTGGSSGQLYCTDCYFVVQNGGLAISFTSSSPTNLVQLYQCSANILDTSLMFNCTALGSIEFYGCQIAGTSTSPSTISSGTVFSFGSEIEVAIATSGSAAIQMYNVSMGDEVQNKTFLQIGGSGTNEIYNCSIISAANPCISVTSTLTLANCSLLSNNSTVISGTGTINVGGLTFPGTGFAYASTLTVNYLNASAASGNLVLISSQVAASSLSIKFLTGIQGFDQYYITYYDVANATNGDNIVLQLSTNGGSTWITTGYTQNGPWAVNGSASSINLSALTGNAIIYSMDTTTTNTGAGNVLINDLASTTFYKQFITNMNCVTNAGNANFLTNGYVTSLSAINALQLVSSGGNAFSGKFKLYGVVR
jgi:hypothetical protein